MSDAVEPAGAPDRPLGLTPERALRDGRRPYAIVDIGSNSVRLVIYDELGRAPLPRFNEKSLCRLAEGLAETGVIAEAGFRRTVETVRRFHAIADAMKVSRIDALATEATRKAANGPALVAAIKAETGLSVRVLSGVEEATCAALGVISGFYRPSGVIGDMGGGSLELAGIDDDRVADGCISLPLGALPAQSLLARYGEDAKTEVDALLDRAAMPALAQPVFYPVGGGWRALAKAHMMANPSPVPVVHGYKLDVAHRARLRPVALAHEREDARPAEGCPDPPGEDHRRRGARARPRAEAARPADRGLFRAGRARRVALPADPPGGALLRSPVGRGPGLRDAPGPRARVRAGAGGLDRDPFPERDHPGAPPPGRRLRALGRRLARPRRLACRRMVPPPSPVPLHRPRPCRAGVPGGDDPRPLWRARRRSDPGSGSVLLAPDSRRRALVLGRAMQLGYRVSGGVPAILANARLAVQGDTLLLRVGRSARVPESEVVSTRLQALAEAIGNCRPVIVEVA